jgi:lipopolysaccharide export system ATP-binding protein
MTVGLVKPDSGRIFLDDVEITEYPMHIRARKGVGYLPQEASVFRKLTVRQNILAILEALPLSRGQRIERTESLLAELGIAHVSDSRAAVLSGGERRRLEISRALATEPAFMLLDEPFAGIDPLAVIDIKKIIAHLKNRNIGILISDHNVRETLEACDSAFILSDGKVIEAGTPAQIAASKIARRIYLGDEFKL